VIRLDAGYWGLRLIAWIHTTLGAVAVIPWNPKRQKNRSCLPPTWTADELGKRAAIERFFARIFSLFGVFRLQRPPLCGWSAVAIQVALVYAATVAVGLAAQQANRPDLIRSPRRVLAESAPTGRTMCRLAATVPYADLSFLYRSFFTVAMLLICVRRICRTVQ
jgi:hypothetical protein